MVRLLIVDDEREICEEFRETLEQEGFEVDFASTGQEGLEKISRREYSLVFLDESMPTLTGDKVFQAIRRISRVPVAFISGFITPEMQRKVLAMGAVTCFQKPLDLNRVKSLISAVENVNRAHTIS